MKRHIIIILAILAILGSASGWIYHVIESNSKIPQNEARDLQLSFLKQYGVDATIVEMIIPKIYEVAWTDKDGNKNVSMNVGGVWVLIASIPKAE